MGDGGSIFPPHPCYLKDCRVVICSMVNIHNGELNLVVNCVPWWVSISGEFPSWWFILSGETSTRVKTLGVQIPPWWIVLRGELTHGERCPGWKGWWWSAMEPFWLPFAWWPKFKKKIEKMKKYQNIQITKVIKLLNKLNMLNMDFVRFDDMEYLASYFLFFYYYSPKGY